MVTELEFEVSDKHTGATGPDFCRNKLSWCAPQGTCSCSDKRICDELDVCKLVSMEHFVATG